jgi:tetratricopeptide (TPR) repeat protein
MYLYPFILALIIFGLYKLNVNRKILIVGLGFFFINIFLSQSVLLIDNFMASRYAYLSYLGLFLILADFNERIWNAQVDETWKPKLRILWISVLAIFLVGFSVLTYSRNFVWKDTISLFDDVVAKQPTQAWVYSNRGIAKYRNANYQDALADFNQSLALEPNFALSLYYRGVISYLYGNDEAALADLDRSITNSSNFFPDAYNERGKVKWMLQDTQGALSDFSTAIQQNDYLVEAHFNRGSLRIALGDYQGAVTDFDRAIFLYPEYGAAYYLRGTAKWHLNDPNGSCADAAQGRSLGYQPPPEQVNSNCP